MVGPRTLGVDLAGGGTRRLRGADVIVSTGTRPASVQIPGIVEAPPMAHVEALDLNVVPQRLIVIGGGQVGLERSQAVRRFGSKVTVIERGDSLPQREDDDVAEALAALFIEEGIDLAFSTRILRVSRRSGESVSVIVERVGKETTLTGTHLLVAAGRTPNTENIGLELAGVGLTERGYIKVSRRLESAGGFPAMVGNVAFLTNDVVLLAVSFHLLKQDALRIVFGSIDQ